jgi:general secretion pathway protein I
VIAVPHRGGFPPRPPARRPGISLLEVLLSLAIFLLALVAIGRLVDIGADNALDTQSQATATRLAQSKLAEAEAGAIALDSASSGVFDLEQDWQWSVEPSAENIPNLYTVTVRVSRSSPRAFELTMTQMICDPRQMGNANEAQKPAATTTGGTTP